MNERSLENKYRESVENADSALKISVSLVLQIYLFICAYVSTLLFFCQQWDQGIVVNPFIPSKLVYVDMWRAKLRYNLMQIFMVPGGEFLII